MHHLGRPVGGVADPASACIGNRVPKRSPSGLLWAGSLAIHVPRGQRPRLQGGKKNLRLASNFNSNHYMLFCFYIHTIYAPDIEDVQDTRVAIAVPNPTL
jgi:hypothetical protein